ncbi:hypothetical protein CHUAL_004548 [Chamberlinius hualienensis]
MKIEKSIVFFFLCSLFIIVSGDDEPNETPADKDIYKAVVESCGGHNVEFKRVNGAPPELILLNKNDEEVKRIPLSSYKRDECNNLLIELGFYKRTSKEDEVPENFLNGPYKKEEL